jgi:hypothetical protein
VILTTPLNGLLYIPGGGDVTVGGVSVGGADVAGGAEDLAHVLGEVKAVGIPCAVLLDGERTRGDGLGALPRYIPYTFLSTLYTSSLPSESSPFLIIL